MRRTLLAWLPADLRGATPARCRLRHRRARGRGGAARRRVVAIDLSPTLVGLARERAPRDLGAGSVEFRVGDMLDPALGRFDHVVAMDSLIHYRAGDVVSAIGGPRRSARRRLDALHLRAAHAGAGRDACGRPPVPAQRPRARDRAGRGGGAAGVASPPSRALGALASRRAPAGSPAASTSRRRWSSSRA